MNEATTTAEIVKQTVYLKDSAIIGYLAIEAMIFNGIIFLIGLWNLGKNFRRK